EAFKWTENFLARFRKFIGLIEYSPGFSFSRLGAWKEAPPAHAPLPSFGLHDQLLLYGSRYNILRRAALLFALLCFGHGIFREEKKLELLQALRTPVELWVMLLFAIAMLWGQIFFPQHGAGFGLIAARLGSIARVLAMCILGCVRPRTWNLA